MAIYTLTNGALTPLEQTSFLEEGILERQDLQKWLKKNISVLGDDLLVIDEGFGKWDFSKRHLDLLAIDRAANLVVIELKRDDTGGHAELQAIRYAAMVSTMRFSQAVEIYANFLDRQSQDSGTAKSRLLEFIGSEDDEPENFATDTRIILVASEFSRELTTAVMFLNERDLDIRCVRIVPHKLPDKTLLLDVQQTIPLPEAKDYQVQVKAQAEERRKAIKNSSKDLSKYVLDGKSYGKNRLVQAVVSAYLVKYPTTNFEQLVTAFPKALQGSLGVFNKLDYHLKKLETDPIPRHFGNAQDVLTLGDKTPIVICSQWGVGNIERFIERAKELGFSISKENAS